jgi:hypothetical protein
MGGGSLADLKLPSELAAAIAEMKPADGVVDGDNAWCLAGDNGYLIYTSDDEPLGVKFAAGTYKARWLDPQTCEAVSTEQVKGPATILKPQSRVLWLTRD